MKVNVCSNQDTSHILAKQTDLCYILGSLNPLIGTQVRHLLIILSLFLFSSTFISCAKKSSTEDTTTDYSTTDVTYSGIWIKDNSTSWYAMSNATFDEFSEVNINYSSYRIIDFEAVNIGDEIKYFAIFISDGKSDTHCLRCDEDSFNSFT